MPKTFIYTLLALLIIVGTCIRVHGVGDYYYSEDEAFHVGMAEGKDLGEVLKFSLYETHPPLGNILHHYWLMISDNIWFFRSLSLWFGLALIPLYYRIGKHLNNELTGLCTALLITFSFGGIIQSYIARNYTIFLFFISYAFYYYLRWRNEQATPALIYYVLFALLACMTHFSGIMTVFTIAIYEFTLLFIDKTPLNIKTKWAAANIIIVLLWGIVYYIWRETCQLAKPYFDTTSYAQFAQLAQFPVMELFYIISPSKLIILPLLLALIPALDNKRLRPFLALLCIAFAIGMGASAAGLYPARGSRQDMWLMPFLIPVAGWVIADGIALASVKLAKFLPSKKLQEVMLVIFLLAELVLYNPERRFAEFSEYEIHMQDWKNIDSYMDALDAKSLLIADKDDAILFANFYPYLGGDMFTGKHMATVMPYKNTRILFNPYYRHMRTKNILFATLAEAKQRGMMGGVDTLVFVSSLPKDYENTDFVKQLPYSELASCATLDKKLVTLGDHFKLLLVSKQTFFDQLVAESGSAHGCLKEYPVMEKSVEP